MLGWEGLPEEEIRAQRAWLQCYASFCKGDQPLAPGLAEPWEPYRIADRNGVFIDGHDGFSHGVIEAPALLARLWRELFLGDAPGPSSASSAAAASRA